MHLFSRAPKPNWSTHPSHSSSSGSQQPPVGDQAEKASSRFVNAVYYPSWRIYRQQPPSSMNLAYATHAFYAFARLRHDGTVYLHDEYADTQIDVDGTKGCLNALVALKKQYPTLKVLLSIGGGGEGSITFAGVASNPVTRQHFASSATALVDTYKLDGIDIDWEHPSDPRQGSQYLLLLAALRSSLPAPFILTTALPAGEWALRNINIGQAAAYLDFINMMAYDFAGPWTSRSGHQSQLFTPKHPTSDAARASGQSAIDYLVTQGVPSTKIVLGIPAYGRSFHGAKKPGDKFTGQGGEEGVFEYRDLPRPEAKEYVDRKLGAAYCVGGDGGFVTYDNRETVQMKAAFAKQHQLGGLFFWTGTGDANPPRSLVQTAFAALNGT